MKFFSGFALKGDQRFFESFLLKSDYTVAGFSYGAIKAARYAAEAHERIDTLQLFSPAFFQTKKESFRRLQMGGYLKDPESYIDAFIGSCFAPYACLDVDLGTHNADELHELLYFVWESDLIKAIRDKGICIEVYLGLEDRIIDAAGAREFFLPYATVTSIKQGNHFLEEQ